MTKKINFDKSIKLLLITFKVNLYKMKDRVIINPTTLKGFEIQNRIKELMGTTLNEGQNKNSSVELTKIGPDGKVYGIVRENQDHYIKIVNGDKNNNLIAEDFSYIGGLQNKKSEAYPSYAKAIKHLNLKFLSISESLGKTEHINVFKNDNLLSEHHMYSPMVGFSSERGMGDSDEYVLDDLDEVIELTELEQSIDDMRTEDNSRSILCPECGGDGEVLVGSKLLECSTCGGVGEIPKRTTNQFGGLHETEKKKRLSIESAINDLDDIIDNLGSSKKKIK